MNKTLILLALAAVFAVAAAGYLRVGSYGHGHGHGYHGGLVSAYRPAVVAYRPAVYSSYGHGHAYGGHGHGVYYG